MADGQIGALGQTVLHGAAKDFKNGPGNVTALLPLMAVNPVRDPRCKRRPAQMTVQVLI